MTEGPDPLAPSIARIVGVVALGGVALVAGFLTPAGRATLIVGALLLVLVTLVGVAMQRQIRQAVPPIEFDAADPSEVDAMIDSARSRLATGDSAAFAFGQGVDENDAEAQIWVYASEAGVPGKVAVELAYPGWPDNPAQHPALTPLLDAGWKIDGWEAGQWVLLGHSGLLDTGGLSGLVVHTLSELFDEPGQTWTCRAFA